MAGFYAALVGTPPTIHWPALSPPRTAVDFPAWHVPRGGSTPDGAPRVWILGRTARATARETVADACSRMDIEQDIRDLDARQTDSIRAQDFRSLAKTLTDACND